MDSNLRLMLIIAVAGAAVLGAILGLLAEPPVPVIVVHADPAAYDIAGLLDEAREITAEAADDAR